MNKKISNKIFIVWLVIVLLGGGLYYYLYLFESRSELSQMREELAVEEERSNALRDRLRAQEIDEEDDEFSALRAKIPETLREDEVLTFFNSLTDRTNTVISSYTYEERGPVTLDEVLLQESNFGNVEIQRLTMQINGRSSTLNNFSRFIEGIENSERIINIDSLRFQSVGENEISFQMVFSVYAYEGR